MNEREYILYRWWDASGSLLYVGKSVSLFSRIVAHRRASGFFPAAALMTMERFPDERLLAEAEVQAIRTEHPMANVAHNAGDGMPKKVVVTDPGRLKASHWSPVTADEIRWGMVIRCSFEGRVVYQGLVDDDLYDCDECAAIGLEDECVAWIIWADNGNSYELHDWEVGIYDTDRWVSIDRDDSTKEEMFSRWLNARQALIGKERAAA